MGLKLGDPVTYSTRRQYLDRDLDREAGLLAGRVLEIGCGRTNRRGRFRPPPAAPGQWIYVDRDVARSPHICGDIGRLPIRNSVFDTVLCLEVLEYVWDPSAALAELRRLLKPGGTLLLSTPFLHRVDAADDYWRFTEPALRRMLGESGFEVMRCLPQGGAFAVIANVLRHAVSVQGDGSRRLLSVLLRPVFAGLLGLDGPASRRRPVLGTYATGYLVIARRSPTEPA